MITGPWHLIYVISLGSIGSRDNVNMTITRLEKPTDNGLKETFNGRLRVECMDVHEFKKIEANQ